MPATNLSSVTCNGDTPGIFPNGPTGAPVSGDPVQIARLATIQAVAAATGDTSVAMPLGARIVGITAIQAVAPTGATDTMQVGTTVGGVDIAPAQDVKTAVQTSLNFTLNGSRPLLVGNFASVVASSAGGSIIWIRINQGTPTAVGTWTVFIEYVMA